MKTAFRYFLAVVFIVAWSVLGGFTTLDTGMPLAWGMTIGGAFGLLLGVGIVVRK